MKKNHKRDKRFYHKQSHISLATIQTSKPAKGHNRASTLSILESKEIIAAKVVIFVMTVKHIKMVVSKMQVVS